MPSQAEIAEHLGVSQAAVSKAMMKLTLDWRTASMDEIRLAYLSRLRAEAAGHVSSSGLDLVEEKAKTERVTRELKQMELERLQGILVSIEDLQADLTIATLNFKNILLGRNERLKATLDALYGIDVDIGLLNDETYEALEVLANSLDGDGASALLDRSGPEAGAETVDDGVGGEEPLSLA